VPWAYGEKGINVIDAWDVTTGSKSVKVAVIDGGFRADVPHLEGKLYRGKDYSFSEANPDRPYINEHALKVISLIGGSPDPKAGIPGIAREVSLVPFSYEVPKVPRGQERANLEFKRIMQAIRKSSDLGARVINMSLVNTMLDQDFRKTLEYAEKKGVIIVAGAGNEKIDIDAVANHRYPACAPLSNIISVAGTSKRGDAFYSSNRGRLTVHVAAPGEDVESATVKLKGFGKDAEVEYGFYRESGTSFAAPLVSGVIALLLSKYPKLTPVEVRNILMETSNRRPELHALSMSGGQIDAAKAVNFFSEEKFRVIPSNVVVSSEGEFSSFGLSTFHSTGKLTYEVTQPSIARVKDGKVEGLRAGKTTIEVRDGSGKVEKILVEVVDPT
jgi:subtilisin family serine protease